MTNNVMQAVSANGIGVLLLVTTLLNFYRKYRSRNTEQKVFAAMLFANLSQCMVEGATFLVDGVRFSGDVAVATMLNASLFANSILYAALWSVYAELRVNGKPSIQRIVLKALPAMAVFCGAIANLFTPVFFRITPENVYMRTPLFNVSLVITYAYLLLGTLVAYRSRRKGEQYVLLPAVTFLLPVVLGSMLQVLFQGISLMWVGAAIGMNYAYISLVDEGATVDALSGAFSRQQLNRVVDALAHEVTSSKPVAGIMLDIDDFKSINDKHGHLVGDEAIRAVGRLLRSASRGYGRVYRYAGDEFTIILPLVNGHEAEEVMVCIQEALDKFNASGTMPCPLSLSMGYTRYIPGEQSQYFIRRMDTAMYQHKHSR